MDAKLEISPSSRNITIEEYQKHQKQHKRIPRDIEFFAEKDTPVVYQIQHEDNPNDIRNDFCPNRYKRSNEEKILQLQNDGEDFTVSSILDKLPITSIQQASDCFPMGRVIKQFRRICGTETQSNLSVNTSNTDYSSVNSFSSSADDTADPTSHRDDSRHISTDSEDGNIVCDISIQTDKHRPCQAKQAHELVLGKTDASLVKKLLTTSEAPHLNTMPLIEKLDEVAKAVNLDVWTILAEDGPSPWCCTFLDSQKLSSRY